MYSFYFDLKHLILHLPVFASSVGNCTPLSRRIHVTVATVTCTIGIGFLLKVNAIFLCIGGTEFAIAGKVTLFTNNSRCLGILIVTLTSGNGK